MRKNRKMSKRMSVMAGRSVQIGAVMLMAFVMAILYMLAATSCKQLTKMISEKERQLAKLEDAQKRESAHWDEMKTKLETALLRRGLSMKYAEPTHVVRIGADGKVYPGQISVARAAERNRIGSSASYKPAKRQRR